MHAALYLGDSNITPIFHSLYFGRFRHNAVCPFGLMNAIPVVISEACLTVRPRYLYMGGGAVNTKLGLALDDFVDAFKPIIADVSEPR